MFHSCIFLTLKWQTSFPPHSYRSPFFTLCNITTWNRLHWESHTLEEASPLWIKGSRSLLVILISGNSKEAMHSCICFFFSPGRSGSSPEVREAVSQQFPFPGCSHQTCLSGKQLFKPFFNKKIWIYILAQLVRCLENALLPDDPPDFLF